VNQVEPAAPRLSRDVLSFFLRNPNAADSLEGVARWRLLDEAVRHTVEEADRAVRWLLVQGFLREVSTSAAGRIYMLNPDRRAEAESFLAAAARK
jgi:hypothetical protein